MPRIGALAISILLCGSQVAASNQPNVLRDTEFQVTVCHTVKARSAKVGDKIEFETDNPVLIGDDTVVPGNAILVGTVTEVRRRSRHSPGSLIRIAIHTLRWKHGEVPLNGVVSGVLRGHPDADWNPLDKRTFMEGIRIAYHPDRDATTDFWSTRKNVTIRGGVELIIRQVDPVEYATNY